MSQQKRQLKQQIGLVGAIFGTLILSLPAIAQTNPSPRDPRSGTGSDAVCSADTSDTNINRQGPSSVNSNRNTPTSDVETRDSRTDTTTPSSANSNRNTPITGTDNSSTRMGNMSSGTGSSSTSSSNTDIERRTREGTSSVNSSRNTPTEDSANSSVDDTNSSSASTDAMSDRDRNAIRTGDEANCSTDGNSTNINRDKQLRRNDYQMMQQRRNTRIISPTPEQRQAASAMVRPSNGAVNVKLVNETGADIVYEVIGETNQRNLQGESYVSLESLGTPTTITFYRADGGLLRVRPQAVAPGLLEVRLAATTDLGADRNALTVQPTGGVYVN
ncbi:hypothetical protein [Aerosakkonema funiforme]|uniref:hypothetical protein n=1 Tax=Aerosakkonema funiforme TaxID=1246630 RepID=UPI0035B7B65B